MNTVKVAAFRNETDRLFRLANADYCACVGVREVENWQKVASRALAESADLACNRATAYDHEQWASALKALKDTLEDSAARLERIKADTAAKAKRPTLRVLSPCEIYSHDDRTH